ncbi:MAG: efflux RND transporter periplasmic adaptor subunit [Deltaproteobacteria bacterium]|nr:efflux RND transporter periplasmic adaptor subunit [Deltaproteobacteria bacterium]
MKYISPLFIMSILLITSCSEKTNEIRDQTKENPSGELTVTAIRGRDIKSSNYMEYSGTLSSEQDVIIMPAVSGVIAKIFVEEGTFVKKGRLLAVLEQEEFEIGLSQAKNQFESARLSFEQSKIDFERTQKLYEAKAISDAQYEALKLKHQITENQMKMALDGLNMAKKRYDDSFIRAPFDCYVTNRFVSVGTRVNMMPPTHMFRIIDIRNLLFKISVPVGELRNFREGEMVEIIFNDISKKIEEPIHKIVKDIDPRNMSSQVIIKVDNTKYNYELKPGLFGMARIYSESIKNTYILNKKYILLAKEDGEGMVIVSDNGLAKYKKVNYREVDSISVRIISGLSDDDIIVTSGLNILKEGHAIKPVIK